MQYEQFITQVQERANLDTRQRAEQVTQAVLATFGERLYRTEREQLAAQLPEALKKYLFERQEPQPTTPQHTERYVLEEFYNRVGARTDSGIQEAARLAKVVIGVLAEAVSLGQMQQVMSKLPNEYEALLRPEQPGTGFPSL